MFRTEKICNNRNPVFDKGFILEYSFEEVQKLKFNVYDIDKQTAVIPDENLIGSMDCTLGQVSKIWNT